MKKSTLPVASLALKLNYFIFLFLMVFLFSSQLPAFSQVKVLIKCGGTFIEKEFKSYAECGCQEWAYDTYKCKSDKVYGTDTRKTREALETKWQSSLKLFKNDECWGGADTKRRSKVYCNDKKLCSNSGSNTMSFDKKPKPGFFDSFMESVNTLKDNITTMNELYEAIPVVDRAKPGIAGYFEFIAEAAQAANKARDKAMEYQREPTKQIENSLTAIENDLKNYNRQAGTRISSMKSIKASSGKIQKPAGNSDLNNGSHNQANGTNNNSSQNTKLSRKEFDNSFDKFSEELMNAYSTIDPDNPEAFLKKTIPLFRKLGELLQSDPDNDPKMKELAKILTGFNEKSDMDEILAKMTKINELMIRD